MSMQLGINFGGSLEPVAAMGGMMAPGSDVGEGDPGHPPYAGVGHEPVGAFDFYWDEGGEVYRMRDPVVVTPDGGNVECESPGELEFGKKYYCVVTKGEGEGEYKAKVLPEGEAGELDGSGCKSWWKVPLFKVPHRRSEENESDGEAGTQYHVGAIVVGGDGTDEPQPYEVRWAEDVGDNGSLIIWLPGENILSVDGNAVDTTTALTAAGDPYPEGWYVLALDLGEDGAIWLNVTNVLTSPSLTSSATFSNAASTTTTTLPIHVATVEIDAETGTRSIVQNVVGALVLTRGGYNVDHDTLYYADHKSIENATYDSGGSDSSGLPPAESNTFMLKGFGKFTKGDNQLGSFSSSSVMELSTEAMSGTSVLVRVGDADTVDGNELAYVRLKIPESLKTPPTPFQYTEAPDEEHEGVMIRGIVNCVFYFNGELKTLPDFANVPLTGTVYLTGTQAAKQEGATTDPPWQFAIATSPAQAPTGGKAMNIKLYDFTGGKVTMDYRTTFLTLSAGTDGDSAGVDVSTSSYTTQGGGSGIGVTFQPTKNGEDEGDSAGLGIEVEEIQPTTGNPGGFTLKLQRAKNGQADGNPVSVTISNGNDGASVTSATAGTATSSGGKTTTPITFTLSNGNTVGPVNVGAQNGTNATLPDFDFISAIQYASQKLQVKYGHCSGGAITYEQNWTDVFTAIPHSSTVAGSGS